MRVVLSRPAYFLLFLLSLISVVARGQSMVNIHHHVTLGDAKVVLGEWQKSDSNVSIRIDKLRWYVSLPPAGKKGSKAWLLDLADSASLDQQMSRPVNNKISLLFGIDSALQVGGVGTGALDPLRGMYWTWQTGYVQWKMEGAIRVDGLVSPLELHLGGFDGATKSQSMLSDYLIYPTTNSVIAQWDISPFLAEVVRRKKFGVMSPSPIAREYCRIIANGVSFHK
ncbi:MAG: MbnP family protein [Bacteroidota bacterium]